MKKEKIIIAIFLEILLILLFFTPNTFAWENRVLTSVDAVKRFLNAESPYTIPIKDARISVMWKNNQTVFDVFYQSGTPSGTWFWKMFYSVNEVHKFLNALTPYTERIKDARICALFKGYYTVFYIFYQKGDPQDEWVWKLANTEQDLLNYLNGEGSNYNNSIKTARITALEYGNTTLFYVFCQWNHVTGSVSNWSVKISSNPAGVLSTLNGSSFKGGEICSVHKASADKYFVFTNKGTNIWIQSPLYNERFVQRENLKLSAAVTSDTPINTSSLIWYIYSTRNGWKALGKGSILNIYRFISKDHTKIEALGFGKAVIFPIRVFEDLGELYEAPLASGEINRILNDFNFIWADTGGQDEQWYPYNNFEFDQTSSDPSKIIAIAKLDILRHKKFSKPLPITNGKTIYNHIKDHVKTIYLMLNCNSSSAGGGNVGLNRFFNVWDMRNSERCKEPTGIFYNYIYPL